MLGEGGRKEGREKLPLASKSKMQSTADHAPVRDVNPDSTPLPSVELIADPETRTVAVTQVPVSQRRVARTWERGRVARKPSEGWPAFPFPPCQTGSLYVAFQSSEVTRWEECGSHWKWGIGPGGEAEP